MILFQRQRRTLASVPTPHAAAAPSSHEIRLELTHPAHPDLIDTLHVTRDACTTFVRGPDWWVWAATPVGLDCFPDLTTLLSPSRPLEAILTGLEDLGLVAFVARCQRSGALYFGRSFEGATSLLFAEGDERLVIGDARLTVAQAIGEVRLSDADQRVWCESLMLDPEGSFYDGVKRCFAGVRYRVAPGSLAIEDRRLMAPESRVRADVDPVDILTEGLRQVFATYVNRRVALRLSGGADSRVLLVGLMDAVEQGILHRDQVLCTSVVFPGMDCDESEAIARITELAGFEWAPIRANQESVARAQQRCLQLDTPVFPTGFIGVLCVEEARRRGANLILSGHGGDELFGINQFDVLQLSLPSRVRRLSLIRHLRQVQNLSGEARALALGLLGTRGLLTLRSELKKWGMPREALLTWRLARRVMLAKGCGYESNARLSHTLGLRADLPFFRGPFLARIDPTQSICRGHPRAKLIAHHYLHSHAEGIANIGCRKVLFGELVARYGLGPKATHPDALIR